MMLALPEVYPFCLLLHYFPLVILVIYELHSPLGFVVLVVSGHWFSLSGHLLPFEVCLCSYESMKIIIWTRL